jgi:hypothetical protein
MGLVTQPQWPFVQQRVLRDCTHRATTLRSDKPADSYGDEGTSVSNSA